MLRFLFIFICGLLSLSATPQKNQLDFSYPSPENSKALTKLTLWSTQYYIPVFHSGGTIPFNGKDGKPLGLYADSCNFCKAAMEGTAYLIDSLGAVHVLNFAGRGEKAIVPCRLCPQYANSKIEIELLGKALWSKSSGYGNGVKNYKLIPYRTIAVDSKKIPYGTVLYIPLAKGKQIELPDGSYVLHDGYFFAGDTGSTLHDNHIDLFTGINSKNPFPEIIKSNAGKTFEAWIVSDPQIVQMITELHGGK